jgi:hypothetical protein
MEKAREKEAPEDLLRLFLAVTDKDGKTRIKSKLARCVLDMLTREHPDHPL